MIETLANFSSKLNWMKPLIILLGLGFFALSCATVLGVQGIDSDVYLVPSVLAVIWSMLVLFMISTFPHVPPKPDKDIRLLMRFRIRLKRGIYYLLGLVFLVITLALLMLSFKLFGIWRADF